MLRFGIRVAVASILMLFLMVSIGVRPILTVLLSVRFISWIAGDNRVNSTLRAGSLQRVVDPERFASHLLFHFFRNLFI